MDKEKILSQNKKENLYLDEYEKHIKLQGKSFGLMFVLFICILLLSSRHIIAAFAPLHSHKRRDRSTAQPFLMGFH